MQQITAIWPPSRQLCVITSAPRVRFAHAQASLKSRCHAWGGLPCCAGKLRRCTQMIRGRLLMFNMNPFIANGCALRFATWKSRSTVRSCQARANCRLKKTVLKWNRDMTTRTNCSWKESLLTRNREMTTSNDKLQADIKITIARNSSFKNTLRNYTEQ